METLINVTNSPFGPKIIIKNSTLLENLESLQSTGNPNIDTQFNGLIDNFTRNKIIRESLINTHPNFIQNIVTTVVNDEKKSKVQILINLFNQSVKKLVDANIVSKNDLEQISDKFPEEESICLNIKEVLESEDSNQIQNLTEDVYNFIN